MSFTCLNSFPLKTEIVLKYACNFPASSHLEDIDGLVQDCSNSIANALELLQSCAKLSTCFTTYQTRPREHGLIQWENITYAMFSLNKTP